MSFHKPKKVPSDLAAVRERLHYCPDTGEFRWIIRNGRNCGKDRAGGLNGYGYIKIGIDGTQYSAHHLAWYLHHGEWPQGEIDHINGDRADNRISNLRVVSHRQNQRNRGVQCNNRLGLRGVVARTTKDGRVRFSARLWKDRKRYTALGTYATAEEASAAVEAARLAAYGP